MDLPQRPVSLPIAPVDQILVPTTEEEEYPRFRILIVGRSGVGKSSLINAIFKASLAEVQHGRAGATNINEGIASPHNKHLILHDSQGYEPGDIDKFDILDKFITEQTQKSPADGLHAIWLCIPASYSGNRMFETGEEKIFKLNQNKVPIIVVVTKFDLFLAGLAKRGKVKGLQLAEQTFKHMFGHKFDKFEASLDRRIPYALVSKSQPETLQRLVRTTMECIGVETLSSMGGLARDGTLSLDWIATNQLAGLDEARSSSIQIAFATAQRVDMAGKIEASIQVGKRNYWRAIASGIHFLDMSLEKCLYAIHNDLITIWNFRDLHELLVSDAFRRRMMVIVEDLKDTGTMQSKVTVGSAVAGLAKLWANAVYKKGPEHIRCLVGYVVDLTLILQAMFQVSLQDRSEGKVTAARVDEIIYEFHCSEKKKNIHTAIRTFVEAHHKFAKDNVVEKIQSLLKENEMTQTDTQLNKERPALRSLLTILRLELTANGVVVNQVILGLVCELLVLPDFCGIVSDLDSSDVELLLDFTLYLLQNNGLSTCGIPDANRKARGLMSKLISETSVIPQSLYITNINTDTDLGTIGIGGHGRILQGKHNGKAVVLKIIDKRHKDLSKEFFQEALAWRSLSHRFILPLLGILREKSQLFLVSSYMENGTLTQWRKDQPPLVIPDVHRLILEAAQGVEYIHSEGFVHGSLAGDSILLDSDFHCCIADFGLARHFDTTQTGTMGYSPNFSAPELFRTCSQCGGEPGCDMHEDHYVQSKKTMETDVYAFGCLYYSTFFDTVPYAGESMFRIDQLVTTGQHPNRLEFPKMEDDTWSLIQSCWRSDASERPTMQQIVIRLEEFSSSPTSIKPPILPSLSTALSSLLASLHKLNASGGSMARVRDDAVHSMGKLLALYESDAIASRLRSTSDIELFLDFVLDLLRNNSLVNLGVQETSQKARRLMFKLISMTNTIPKFLYITDVKIEAHLGPIETGGFGRIYIGKYKWRQVTLKVVNKIRNDELHRKDLAGEAIAWQSLYHGSILPLLGIFEERSQLFLVSPLMVNGTLTEWRGKQEQNVADIPRMMLEVAEGIRYLHSEGIIHGDLHGRNVLLDSEFHCQITDFESIRHSEAIVTRLTTALSLNFAAPELFGMCPKCGQLECSGCYEDGGEQYRSKTEESDVYAFGCLYYAIFFDAVPFHGNSDVQVVRLVTNGVRPIRLGSPRMANSTWDLIQISWKSIPSERPKMEQIVTMLTSFAQATSGNVTHPFSVLLNAKGSKRNSKGQVFTLSRPFCKRTQKPCPPILLRAFPAYAFFCFLYFTFVCLS